MLTRRNFHKSIRKTKINRKVLTIAFTTEQASENRKNRFLIFQGEDYISNGMYDFYFFVSSCINQQDYCKESFKHLVQNNNEIKRIKLIIKLNIGVFFCVLFAMLGKCLIQVSDIGRRPDHADKLKKKKSKIWNLFQFWPILTWNDWIFIKKICHFKGG